MHRLAVRQQHNVKITAAHLSDLFILHAMAGLDPAIPKPKRQAASLDARLRGGA